MHSTADLPRTGERFVPGMAGDIVLEHLHRYALAQDLVLGKRVLDLGCGEGYGSYMLAEKAMSVIGVDISAEAVAHATDKYRVKNLEFRRGDCGDLPLPNASVDLAVCFETLEHHAEHDSMLKELRRVLTPDGVMLLSTPDRQHYSDERDFSNPFHVRELYADEFRQLTLNYFPHATFYGQRVVYASVVASLNSTGEFVSFSGDNSGIVQNGGLAAPFYLIAVASAGSVPALPPSLFDGTRAWQEATDSLIEDLADTRNQLVHTRAHLESIHASIYWRISYPLRLVRKAIKQTFGI